MKFKINRINLTLRASRRGNEIKIEYQIISCRLLTYLLTPRYRVLLEKPTGLQLVKKFPAFHGTRKFITAFTSVRHLSLSWASPTQVHIPTSHLLEIHPNIIHPSTPRSPQWSPSLRFPQQDPIHPLSSPIRATCPAHFILLDFITRTIFTNNFSCRLAFEKKNMLAGIQVMFAIT